MTNFNPTQHHLKAPFLDDHILKVAPDGKTLSTKAKNRGCGMSLLLCKMFHWITHSSERISRVREAIAHHFQSRPQDMSTSQCANLFVNANYFNERVIRSHNSTWASFFMFWSRVNEINSGMFYSISVVLFKRILVCSDSLEPSMFSANSLAGKTQVLLDAYHCYNETSPFADLDEQTPVVRKTDEPVSMKAKRNVLFGLIKDNLPLYVQSINDQVGQLEKKGQWSNEDENAAIALNDFLNGDKFKQIRELSDAKNLDSAKARWAPVYAKYQAETKTVQNLKIRISENYAQLLGFSNSAITRNSLNNIVLFSELQSELDNALACRCVSNEKKDELKSIHTDYAALLKWIKSTHTLLQKFDVCKACDLEKLKQEIDARAIPVLPPKTRDLASKIMTFVESYSNTINKSHRVFQDWLKIEGQLTTQFIEEQSPSLQTLQKETTRSLSFSAEPPFISEIDAVAKRVMEKIKARDLEYTGWTRKINECKNSLQSAGTRYLISLEAFEKPVFNDKEFEAYLNALPESQKKKDLMQERVTLKSFQDGFDQIATFIKKTDALKSKFSDDHVLTDEELQEFESLNATILPSWTTLPLMNSIIHPVRQQLYRLNQQESDRTLAKLSELDKKLKGTDISSIGNFIEEINQSIAALEKSCKRLIVNTPSQLINFRTIQKVGPAFIETVKNLESKLEAARTGKDTGEFVDTSKANQFLFVLASDHPVKIYFDGLVGKLQAARACTNSSMNLSEASRKFKDSPSSDNVKLIRSAIDAASAALKLAQRTKLDEPAALKTLISEAENAIAPYENYYNEIKIVQGMVDALENNVPYDNMGLRTLLFFTKMSNTDSPHNRIKKLLANPLMDETKRKEINAKLQKSFPEVVWKNIPLMEKAAGYWKSDEAGELSAEELLALASLQNDSKVPLGLQVQAELIQQAHALKFHPKTLDIISLTSLTDAVQDKNHVGHYYNRRSIMRWIHMKGENPMTRKALKAEDLQDRPDITKLVQEWRQCKEAFLKPGLVKADAKASLISDIAEGLPVDAQNLMRAWDFSPQQIQKARWDFDQIYNDLNGLLEFNDANEINSFKGLVLECNLITHKHFEHSGGISPNHTVASLARSTENLEIISAVFETMEKGLIDQAKLQRLKADILILHSLLGNAAAFTEPHLAMTNNIIKMAMSDAMRTIYEIMSGFGTTAMMYNYITVPVYIPRKSERKRVEESLAPILHRIAILDAIDRLRSLLGISDYRTLLQELHTVSMEKLRLGVMGWWPQVKHNLLECVQQLVNALHVQQQLQLQRQQELAAQQEVVVEEEQVMYAYH